MKALIYQINQFYKLAQETSLSDMLLKALKTNDVTTYLVFLDRLELEMPEVKDKIIAAKNLKEIVSVLSEVFPKVIHKGQGGDYVFRHTGNDGIKSIEFKTILNIIDYSLFSLYLFNNGGRRVFFTKGKAPKLNGREITSINKLNNNISIYSIDSGGNIGNKEDEKWAESLLSKIEAKALLDFNSLKTLLETRV